MRQLGTRLKKVKFGTQAEALLLEFIGYINAATFIDYERTLKNLLAKQITNLGIDFKEVEYINSSGMGMLLSVHDALAKVGGALVLLSVSPQVGQTMHILGVSQVVPFLKNKNEMASFFLQRTRTAASGRAAPAEATARAKGPIAIEKAAQALAAHSDGKGPRHPVMVLAPAADVFTDLLKIRLKKSSEHFHILHDCSEAWAQFPQIQPDLVILEDSLPGADEFLGKVKTDRDKCHVSVIKLYAKAADPATRSPFKIWENDYLTEPFEMKELFALAEAELLRVPRDRKTLLFQAHYTFQYSEPNLNRALQIGKGAIFQAHLAEDKAVPLYAAFQEAVDNALRHGNRYDKSKRVDVTLLVTPAEIVITVEDEGKGFDSSKYVKLATDLDAVSRTRLAREEGKIGGLGIKLMLECTDRVEYLEKGRRVRLTKKTGAAPTADAKPAAAVQRT